jgi:hypothetical protein
MKFLKICLSKIISVEFLNLFGDRGAFRAEVGFWSEGQLSDCNSLSGFFINLIYILT